MENFAFYVYVVGNVEKKPPYNQLRRENMSGKMKAKIQPMHIVAGIAVFGFVLRVWGSLSKGLLFWDEAIFHQAARFVRWKIGHAIAEVPGFLGVGAPHHFDASAYSGFPVFMWKPGHIMILSLMSLPFGDVDYLGSLTSALFGAATIPVLYLLTKELLHREVYGIMAAAALAVSNYHLLYSRIGMHETDSGFFILLAAFILLKPEGETKNTRLGCRSFLAGLALGAGIVTSYRWTMFIPAFGLFLLVRYRLRIRLFIAGLPFAFGVFLPMLLLEPAYRWFFRDYADQEFTSYFGSMAMKFQIESVWDWSRPFFYPKMFYQIEGILPSVLVIAGFVLAIRRFRKGWIPLVFIILPLIPFSFTLQRLTRTISALLPWTALLAGWALGEICIRFSNRFQKKKPYSGVAAAVIISVFFVCCVFHAKPIFQMKARYRAAINWMRQNGDQRHFSTMWTISAYYAGRENALRVPASWENFRKMQKQSGVRYILVDWQKYVFAEAYPQVARIEEKYRPVCVFDNPYTHFRPVLHENYLPEDVEGILRSDPTVTQIKIYDLREVFADEDRNPR